MIGGHWKGAGFLGALWICLTGSDPEKFGSREVALCSLHKGMTPLPNPHYLLDFRAVAGMGPQHCTSLRTCSRTRATVEYPCSRCHHSGEGTWLKMLLGPLCNQALQETKLQ